MSMHVKGISHNTPMLWMLLGTSAYKCVQETPRQPDMDADFGFLQPLNIISPKQTYLHFCIPVTWKSQSLSPKEELRAFPATLLFWSSPLKMELSRIWLRGLEPRQSIHPTCKKKSHFYSSHQLFLCSAALAQVDAELYSLLEQTMNVRTNAFRTGNTILGYACLLFSTILASSQSRRLSESYSMAVKKEILMPLFKALKLDYYTQIGSEEWKLSRAWSTAGLAR